MLFVITVGFILLGSVPIILAFVSLKWVEQIRIAEANFWIAAAFSFIPIAFYAVLVSGAYGKLENGLLLGNMFLCVTGGLASTIFVFFQGPLRDYYTRAWQRRAESRQKKMKNRMDANGPKESNENDSSPLR